jgi:hypothetical protein
LNEKAAVRGSHRYAAFPPFKERVLMDGINDFQVYARNEAITATNANQQIMTSITSNPPRVEFVIQNLGTANETISISLGGVAVSGAGITLKNGQSYFQSSGDRFPVWNGSVSIISSAATCAVGLMERRA